MGIRRDKLHINTPEGISDVVHLETDTSVVLRPDGTKLEDIISSNLPENKTEVPTTLTAGKIRTVNGEIYVGKTDNTVNKVGGLSAEVSEKLVLLGGSKTPAGPFTRDADTLQGHDSKYFDDRIASQIQNIVGVSNPTNVPIQFGANTIKNTGKVAMFPKIEFTGHHYVNLLGKVGNCEDVSKWVAVGLTLSIDTSKKVFGNTAIKISQSGNIEVLRCCGFPVNIDPTKYYMASAYVSVETNGGIQLSLGNGDLGKWVESKATTPTRIMTKVAQLQKSDSNGVYFSVNKLSAYIDGIMLNEISADDYNNLTEAQLLAKYPYVDSYGALTNPCFENRKYNLVRNGNCEEGVGYWKPDNNNVTVSCENGRFKVVSTGVGIGVGQFIQVKPNTNYYISGNNSGNSNLYVFNNAVNAELKRGFGGFNTGSETVIKVMMLNLNVGTGYMDSLMLTEGTTPPSEYKSCEIERFCLEGQFTDDDKVIIKDGQVSGLLNWKHKTLYGKDYDWQFNTNESGFMTIKTGVITNYPPATDDNSNNNVLTKYDGKILKHDWAGTTFDSWFYWALPDARGVVIEVADSDSGWADNLQPNADEVKAYMNGWKAISHNGTRYWAWWNVTDNSNAQTSTSGFPNGIATTLSVASNNTTSITVTDSSIFKIGDTISVFGDAIRLVSAISGNTVTLNDVVPSGFAIGNVVSKVSADTVNYCKNNVAPNYDGYQLHYKLANPEPITDINIPVKGDIWSLASGGNYVTVDSGIVLGEIAKPQINPYNTNQYYLNSLVVPNDNLKNKNEQFIALYKNDIYDGSWTIDSATPYGKYTANELNTVFDASATYTVDYQILKTLHAQSFGSLSMAYCQDVFSAINSMTNAIEDKQQHNEVLDTLIDLSVYEDCGSLDYFWATRSDGSLWVTFLLQVQPKRTKNPILKYSWGYCLINDVDVSNKLSFESFGSTMSGSTTSAQFTLSFRVTDVTTINNIKTYGLLAKLLYTLDCRGRI